VKKWITHIALFLSLLPIASAQVPFTCEGQFLLTLSRNGDSRLALVEVDPLTNAINFAIINNSMRIDINAIGYRNEENLIYGIDPNLHFLYRVDALGNVENLARLPLDRRLSYFAGDITPDGRYLILIGGTGNAFLGVDEELAKVDLTLPGYPVERIPISGDPSRIYDIAFNPLTGVLYGFDSNNERLVIVDPDNAVVSADFNPTGNVDNAGSLFFDAFGNLYAYGGPFLSEQNRFYAVNTETGEFTVLTSGPNAEGTDACSCPYTVEMKKVVDRDWTYPCEDVVYSFIIANGSGRDQEGIDFVDPLPNGMTFVSIVDNPFGGSLLSQPGDAAIQIQNAIIPAGIDTLRAIVNVGDLPEGRYFNQARLSGLPISLGQVVRSDEPRTLAEEDSTYLDIRRIPFESMAEEFVICDGDSLVLDYADLGDGFIWSDGSTAGRRTFFDADDLSLTITAGCDTAVLDLTILEENIDLFVDEDFFQVRLGDTIKITTTVFNTGDTAVFTWYDHEGKEIDCGECSTYELVPLFSGTYRIQVMNEFGCTDEALVEIEVEKERRIFVPNAITPNFDNLNDRLFVISQDYGKIDNFYVFDRWGEIVYRGSNMFVNDEARGWDGLFNGEPVMPGVYTWMAEITFLDNQTEFFGGDVTVLR
jgi:gliding motility-associated-like protein/uncharacterized repeat protein (TIGR01451 family)